MDAAEIYQIERPHPKLLQHYVIQSILSGPLIVATLPLLYFRYHTLHYKFDDEGVHMRWGILFRREINLTYARIQDIHLTRGVIQRWLGLASIQIQTASGSSSAEMTIEGLLEYETIRDFLYAKMRGVKEPQRPLAPSRDRAWTEPPPEANPELIAALRDVQNELKAANEALEKLANQ
ncbi:PH domain-containing protein [Candidatus Sumerlaeota bacterium]|nr:PH domain-containing protein [Candidatus Sumerlaeota bacterium]